MILSTDAWAVSINNRIIVASVAATRKQAIENGMDAIGIRNWRRLYRKYGCRAIRIEITPQD